MQSAPFDSSNLRCQICAIRHRAVCGALSDEEISSINAIAKRRLYKPGDMILNADDHVDFFANIVSGAVKLTKMLGDGRQQIVGLQFAPDFLGRAYKERSPYFAEAATDVELCLFPRKAFEGLLKEKPGLEMRLFQDTLNELDAARDWMLLLGRKTASEKVASFVEMIARRTPMIGCSHTDEDPDNVHVFLPLSRSEIADYLGLTIETVSRQIGKLKSAGILRLHASREFSVRDMATLREAANIDEE
ncbi:MAG: transcriptional regulator [Rhizobiales bacterium NRL2]|jgi:CRP/FNR family transcriptional regulator|nr:MAG: transcriptional regulator [Rhizobiales bacterium NRL2]